MIKGGPALSKAILVVSQSQTDELTDTIECHMAVHLCYNTREAANSSVVLR